jgi:hypothetical protein
MKDFIVSSIVSSIVMFLFSTIGILIFVGIISFIIWDLKIFYIFLAEIGINLRIIALSSFVLGISMPLKTETINKIINNETKI